MTQLEDAQLALLVFGVIVVENDADKFLFTNSVNFIKFAGIKIPKVLAQFLEKPPFSPGVWIHTIVRMPRTPSYEFTKSCWAVVENEPLSTVKR